MSSSIYFIKLTCKFDVVNQSDPVKPSRYPHLQISTELLFQKLTTVGTVTTGKLIFQWFQKTNWVRVGHGIGTGLSQVSNGISGSTQVEGDDDCHPPG